MSLRINGDGQLLHQQDIVTPASEVDSRTIPAFQELLKRPGSHELEIQATSPWKPRSTEFESFFELSYLVKLPPSHGQFTVSWSDTGGILLPEGDFFPPASVQLQEMKKLQEEGVISYFEMSEQNLLLYWEHFDDNQEVRIPIGLVGLIPGHFVAASSRVFEYYNPENEAWIEGLKMDVIKGTSSFFLRNE